MFRNILAAFLGDAEQEEQDARQATEAPVSNPLPRPDKPPNDVAIDRFNDAIAEVHQLIADPNADIYETLELLQQAADVARETVYAARGPSGAERSANICPHCGRKVASLSLHLRTCSAVAAGESLVGSDVPAAGSHGLADDDPRRDVLSALRSRVRAKAVADLQDSVTAGQPDKARACWCVAASLDDDQGLPAGAVDPTSLFSALLESIFVTFSQDVQDKLDGAARQDKDRDRIWRAVHPVLRRQAPAVIAAANKLHHNGTSSADDQRQHGAPAGAGPSPAPAAGVEAVVALLGEAATWLEQIREQRAPHSARVAVASRLLTACTHSVLPALDHHWRACHMEGVLAIARAAIDHAEGRTAPSDYATPEAWLWEWEAVEQAVEAERNRSGSASAGQSPATAEAGGSAQGVVSDTASPRALQHEDGVPEPLSAPDHVFDAQEAEDDARAMAQALLASRRGDVMAAIRDEPILLVRFAGRGAGQGKKRRDKADASAPPSLAPLPIPLSVATAVLDHMADQACFLSSLVERFIRHARAVLASGKANEPTRGTDELSASLQAMQGHYVLLERSYLLNAVQQALAGGPQPGPAAVQWSYDEGREGWAWSPVAVHEDVKVRTFAWCDAVFFIASKSLGRAAGTGCDMAAAAVANFVAGCLDENVRNATLTCMRLAGKRRAVHKTRNSSGRGGDDLESEVSDRMAQVLLGGDGRDGGRPSPLPSPKRPGARPGAADDDDPASQSLPSLADEAIWAANTVATVGSYAASLYERAAGQLAEVFPLPLEDQEEHGQAGEDHTRAGSRPMDSPTAVWDPPGLSFHPPVHPFLKGPLDMFHSVASSFAFVTPTMGTGTAGAQGGRGGGRGNAKPVTSYIDQTAATMIAAMAGEGLAAFAEALRTASYVLTEDQYDRAVQGMAGARRSTPAMGGTVETLGPSDPVLSTFLVSVLGACRLPVLLPLLARPVLPDATVRALAKLTAQALEEGWGLSSNGSNNSVAAADVNEYGALLMAGQLRELLAALEPHANRGTHRPAFARASQAVAVLGLDAPHDLYSLTFPRPALSAVEVRALLGRRGWATQAERLNWDRLGMWL